MKSQSKQPGTQPGTLEKPDGQPSPNSAPNALRTVAPAISNSKSSTARSLVLGFAFLISATAAATVGTTLALIAPLPGALAPAEGQRLLGDLWKSGFQYQVARPVNILVMGIDRVPDAPDGSEQVFAGRSDTMLLLRIDPTDNTVNLLSIPRDTQVEVPGIGTTKANQANASGGPSLAREAVSTALNGIQIDRYVRVSTNAFRELVDLLGGIDVYVPEQMTYTDNTQKLKIDLSPGWQTLNGNKAEQFARFRQDSYGDIGRVQRQQALIKALRSKLSNPLMLPRVPGLISVMQKYIDTNLSVEEMLALVNFGLKLDKNDFKMVLLPGRFSEPGEFLSSYWILDPQGRDRVMHEYFKVSAVELTSEPGTDLSSTNLRIAVQNASGQPEAAGQFIQYLNSLGYENAYPIQDWADQQSKTQIIVQKGDLQAAKLLRGALRFGSVEAASTGDLDSDLTIRVGNDWLKQQAAKSTK
ncbi:MAG: LCP family protein [Leptolyngbyaceae cyanobacterium CSU_1_3]|nr:LCP family protein [Leptolyngbyaceae cyanobacterium CSU_1_3]